MSEKSDPTLKEVFDSLSDEQKHHLYEWCGALKTLHRYTLLFRVYDKQISEDLLNLNKEQRTVVHTIMENAVKEIDG